MKGLAKTLTVVVLLASQAGCSDWKAQWAYDRLAVNQTTQSQAAAMLPSTANRTTVSLVYLKESKTPPSQELVVCLLDPQGLLVGKLALHVRQEHWGFAKRSTVSFEAELAPVSDPTSGGGGPVNQLRLAYERLRKKQYDFYADRTHGLACAAILRTLEALPDVSASASDHQQFAAHLASIPPNGSVKIGTTEHQTYQFSYQAMSTARGKLTFSPER